MIIKNKKLKKGSGLFIYAFLGTLVFIIIVFLVDANFKINKKRDEFISQINYLQEELAVLEQKKSEYESGLLLAQTDDFWEEKLRAQGYKKPGEDVVVVLHQGEAEKEAVEEKKSLWHKFLEKLGF